MYSHDGKVKADWWLVFGGSNDKHWLIKYLQPGFKHVYAMQLSEGGYMWQVVNCNRSHMTLDLVSVDNYPHPRAYAAHGSTVIPVTAVIDVKKIRASIGVMSCVEVVKAVLGIKAMSVFTPYQLFKYIRGSQ